MTFLGLARKSALRKPLHTALIVICVAVAFLVHALTASFMNGTQSATAASEDILGVINKAGRTHPLPMAYLTRIAADPDVAAVAYMARLRGFLEIEKHSVWVSATDPTRLMAVYGKSLGLTRELIDSINQARDRVLVGRALAEARGWTVGQRITVTSFNTARHDGSRDWRFELAGIFDGENASTDTYFMIARYDYVNAARANGRDTVNAFAILPQATSLPGELASRIDALFANSSAPTRTLTEKQFLTAFFRQYADVGLMVNLVVGAAFITLLSIIINTMVFAVRKRSFEIAVLKTLGFSHYRIMGLILGETLIVFVLGGCIGLALAKLATLKIGAEIGLVLSPLIVAKAAAMMIILGLLTGALPAVKAVRTSIIVAFRRS